MAKDFFITSNFDKEHRHFGGFIYSSDFNTDYKGRITGNGSLIARRIASDFRWEQNLKKWNRKGETNATDRT